MNERFLRVVEFLETSVFDISKEWFNTKLRSNVVELQECMTLEKSSDTKSGLTMPRSRRIVSNKARQSGIESNPVVKQG